MTGWIPYNGAPRKPMSKPRKKSTYPETNLVHLPLMLKVRHHPILGMNRKFLIHVPNEGKCSAAQGNILKAMGLKAGVSDLLLLYPSRGHCGMAMELKAPGGTPTALQMAFMDELKGVGWHVCWFDDPECAYNELLWYLEET